MKLRNTIIYESKFRDISTIRYRYIFYPFKIMDKIEFRVLINYGFFDEGKYHVHTEQ